METRRWKPAALARTFSAALLTLRVTIFRFAIETFDRIAEDP
jgi:hypothetical protein